MAEICMYCGEEILESDEKSYCAQCGTVYHKECYECGWCINCEKFYIETEIKQVYQEDASKQEKRRFKESQPLKEINTAKECVNSAVNYVQTNVRSTLNDEKTGLFANVGESLKGCAKANFVIGVICSIIIFIKLTFADYDLSEISIEIGLGVFLSAWITSLILYAFGELVSNSKKSKEIQQQILDELRNKKE